MHRTRFVPLVAALLLAPTALTQRPATVAADARIRTVAFEDSSGTSRLASVIRSAIAPALLIDPAFPSGSQAALASFDEQPSHVVICALGKDDNARSQEPGFPPGMVFHAAGMTLDVPAPLCSAAVRRELSLGNGKDRVELRVLGRGRTSHDAVVWMPGRHALFAGAAIPSATPDADERTDLAAWLRSLEDLAALRPAVVVPGSGGTIDSVVRITSVQGALESALEEIREQLRRSSALPPPRDALHAAARRTLLRGTDGRLGSERNAAVAIAQPESGAPRPLVYVGPKIDDALRGRLRAVAPNVEYVGCDGVEEALQHAARAHGCDGRFGRTPRFLTAAPQLRYVQAWSAGVDRYVSVPALRDSDELLLCNMRAMSGAPIADHAFGLLLALTRKLPGFHANQARSSWDRSNARGMEELAESTLLVLGLGGIGTEMARRGHGFGMRVLATDFRTEPVPAFVDRIELPDRVDALLPLADVVAICLPLTPQTRGLFDAERIARMRDGAILVNVARGAIVDTQAMLQALESGALGGAALDVTDPEPLPEDHPLWQRRDVVLTPHVAGRSSGTDRRERALFVENIRRFGAGLPLLNVVDKIRGY